MKESAYTPPKARTRKRRRRSGRGTGETITPSFFIRPPTTICEHQHKHKQSRQEPCARKCVRRHHLQPPPPRPRWKPRSRPHPMGKLVPRVDTVTQHHAGGLMVWLTLQRNPENFVRAYVPREHTYRRAWSSR